MIRLPFAAAALACAALFVLPLAAQDILTAVNNGNLEQVKAFLKQNPSLAKDIEQRIREKLMPAPVAEDQPAVKIQTPGGETVISGRGH